MMKALKETIPDDFVDQTLDYQKPPNKLWLEFVFGSKLPNHEIFTPKTFEEKIITIPGIDRTASTFGHFKPSERKKKNRKGIFARFLKKENDKNSQSLKLMNNLENLARRQEKFDNDQKILKETYEKTIKELRDIQQKFNSDLSNLNQNNLNNSINNSVSTS